MPKFKCPRCSKERELDHEVFHDGDVIGDDEPIECACGALLQVDVDVVITLTARVDEDAERDREE